MRKLEFIKRIVCNPPVEVDETSKELKWNLFEDSEDPQLVIRYANEGSIKPTFSATNSNDSEQDETYTFDILTIEIYGGFIGAFIPLDTNQKIDIKDCINGGIMEEIRGNLLETC